MSDVLLQFTDGQLEKLKVYECKAYLRMHKLRLSGNKEVLLTRIRGQIEYELYPLCNLSFFFICYLSTLLIFCNANELLLFDHFLVLQNQGENYGRGEVSSVKFCFELSR